MRQSREEYVSLCSHINKMVKHKHLISYIRDDNRNPVGVVVAYKDDGERIHVGWSKANTKKERFNKHIGIRKAFNRSVLFEDFKLPHYPNETVKSKIVAAVEEMKIRAAKYFKREI